MLLRVLLAIVILAFGCASVEAKRVALVMGNSKYKSFSKLPNPVNDAKLMEKALRDVGFEVTLILNADQLAMKRAMLAFGRKLRKGVDASIFYYAGHGVQVKGRNYLIPIEASLEDEDEVGVQTIDVNDFLETMESAKSPFNIIVLDACRDNPLNATRGGGGGLAPVNAPRGSYIAYATAPGAVAKDGDGANSPYTLALADVLTTPGLKLEDVFKKTRQKVLVSTDDKQVPWETSSIVGDFYFRDAEVPDAVIPVVNAAAAEWALVQNSKSRTVLEAFQKKHETDDLYWGLAEERLAQLAPVKPVEPEKNVAVVGSLDDELGYIDPPALPEKEVAVLVQPPLVKAKKDANCIVAGLLDICLKAGDSFKDCEGCPEMVVVPAGSFMMGSPADEKDRYEDEGPQHKVTFGKSFAVGKFEVTRGQFAEFVSDTGFKTEPNCESWSVTGAHPVVCVSWDNAQAYVNWLSKKSGVGYSLLTEAEWEYVARAGTITPFVTGDTIFTTWANFDSEKSGTTSVGSYAENKFGLFDMAGNVWEWTEDCYEASYKNASTTEKAVQSSSCKRVVRGGGWVSDSRNLRLASRGGSSPDSQDSLTGFRVARTL